MSKEIEVATKEKQKAETALQKAIKSKHELIAKINKEQEQIINLKDLTTRLNFELVETQKAKERVLQDVVVSEKLKS